MIAMNQREVTRYFVFSVIMVDKEGLNIRSRRVSMTLCGAASKNSLVSKQVHKATTSLVYVHPTGKAHKH